MKSNDKNITVKVRILLLTNFILEQGKIPSYSTLNLDVIPRPDFIESLDNYQAKVDPELMKEMLKECGVCTSDERIYKMMSAMVESKLLKVLKEVRIVSTNSNAQLTTGRSTLDTEGVLEPKSHL